MTPVEALLYQHLLGPTYADLPPSAQRLHARRGSARYHGQVEIERGRGLLSRLCAWATRLPPTGCGAITVDIDAEPGCERWTRRVAGHVMTSRLWASNGLLCERLGLVTFGFRLAVEHGRIMWRVARVRTLGLPLPAAAFGGVLAQEFEQDGRYRFDVHARLPLVGLLVHYRGWLDVG